MYVCVCVVHWHCTAQLSMFNMEKRFRNKIIIIIIIIIISYVLYFLPETTQHSIQTLVFSLLELESHLQDASLTFNWTAFLDNI